MNTKKEKISTWSESKYPFIVKHQKPRSKIKKNMAFDKAWIITQKNP